MHNQIQLLHGASVKQPIMSGCEYESSQNHGGGVYRQYTLIHSVFSLPHVDGFPSAWGFEYTVTKAVRIYTTFEQW